MGGIAGLAGGLVFGAMMQMMGMIPMVAMLVGSTSTAVGWAVHLAISFAFGVGFGAAVTPQDLVANTLAGVAWGLVLWVVAALLVMRTVLGAPIQMDTAAMQSLVGHLVYGAILGAGYSTVNARATAGATAQPNA